MILKGCTEHMFTKIQLNGEQLKWIAIVTMTIDHIAAIIFPQYLILRIIGRIAFPIFAFLLAQGMIYTHNPRGYLTRLGVFAILSEIPFDYAFQTRIIEMQHQNIFFTLFLGGVSIYVIQLSNKKEHAYFTTMGIALLAELLNCDYGFTGVVIIVSFYILKEKKIYQFIALTVFSILMGYIQIYAAFACVPIALYNGKRGRNLKWLFYIYYPVHLLILKGIWLLMFYG